MNAIRIMPARPFMLALAALGGLALVRAGNVPAAPLAPTCAAEAAARAQAAPGFVALAGNGDPRCLEAPR